MKVVQKRQLIDDEWQRRLRRLRQILVKRLDTCDRGIPHFLLIEVTLRSVFYRVHLHSISLAKLPAICLALSHRRHSPSTSKLRDTGNRTRRAVELSREQVKVFENLIGKESILCLQVIKIVLNLQTSRGHFGSLTQYSRSNHDKTKVVAWRQRPCDDTRSNRYQDWL